MKPARRYVVLLGCGGRTGKSNGLHRPVLGLEDFDCDPGNPDTDAGFGDIAKVLQNESVQRLGSIYGELQPKGAIDVPQSLGTLDHDSAIVAPVDRFVCSVRAGGEFADDLLDDVFKGYETKEFSVLVYDQSQALAIFLKELELGIQAGSGRNIVRLCEVLLETLGIPVAVQRMGQETA